jgi:hypothetical protein
MQQYKYKSTHGGDFRRPRHKPDVQIREEDEKKKKKKGKKKKTEKQTKARRDGKKARWSRTHEESYMTCPYVS